MGLTAEFIPVMRSKKTCTPCHRMHWPNKKLATSLDEALDALDQDRTFLCQGNVFSNDMIDAYLALKQQDILRVKQMTHPVEFELYYSL